MKLMITGSNGRLGMELRKVFPTALHTTRKELDFTNFDKCMDFIQTHKPDVIIHAGAKAGVKLCEDDKVGAWKTNVGGTANLVKAIEVFCPQTHLIYISTPCVFSGEEEEINESTLYCPKSYYGVTKMVGEIMALRAKNCTILRSNFVAYKPYEHKRAFTDRKSRYLFAHDLAKAIADFLKEPKKGIVHVVGEKEMSMYELAKLCPKSEDVEAYTLEEYYRENPNADKLTQNMNLISTVWEKTYKITVPGENKNAKK